jgi:hypothetical protein
MRRQRMAFFLLCNVRQRTELLLGAVQNQLIPAAAAFQQPIKKDIT